MSSFKAAGFHYSSVTFALAWLWLLAIELAAVDSNTKTIGPMEFCNMETFNATCRRDEVIVMRSARYGRMKIGRCVKGNYGYLGCAADVLSYVDTKCSGRHTCKLVVPDTYLHDSKPCPGDFTSYMEASYACLKVATGSRKECEAARFIKLTSQSGYISSTLTEQEGLGSVHCPWWVRVKDGQRIRFTLLSFVGTAPTSPEGSQESVARRQDTCYDLAVVLEEPVKKTIRVCPGEKRERTVFLSRSNSVKVAIVRRRLLSSAGAFLLKYEAVGCPDLKPLLNTLARRKGDDSMEVRCNSTEQTWYLSCKGTTWVGDYGNCTHVTSWNFAHLFGYSSDTFPYGILLVVAIGVALGIVFGGIMLVFVVLYTRRRRQQETDQTGTGQNGVLENKPIIIPNVNQAPEWSHRISHHQSEDSGYRGTGRDHVPTSPLPAMPGFPDPPPGTSDTPTRTFITLERETHYGSAGMTVTSGFSSFKPANRQHIYESPNFQ